MVYLVLTFIFILFLLQVLTEDSVEHLCILGRLVSAGDDLSDTK